MYYFITIFGVAILIILPSTSEAYLDPGTGSFVFQMIIAAGLGGLFTLKTYWRKIKGIFKKDKKK